MYVEGGAQEVGQKRRWGAFGRSTQRWAGSVRRPVRTASRWCNSWQRRPRPANTGGTACTRTRKHTRCISAPCSRSASCSARTHAQAIARKHRRGEGERKSMLRTCNVGLNAAPSVESANTHVVKVLVKKWDREAQQAFSVVVGACCQYLANLSSGYRIHEFSNTGGAHMER